MRLIVVSAALFFLLVPVASAKRQFAIVDLGTLGGKSSTATALNGKGQVVGASATPAGPEHAFSWAQAGGMVDLGTPTAPFPGYDSAAAAVNEAGQVVGTTRDVYGAETPSRWTPAGPAGTFTSLTFTMSGSYGSGAVAVNDAGQVAGNIVSSAMMFRSHAFSWTPDGRDFVSPLPGGGSTYARAMNESGQVVGGASTDSYYPDPAHAFSWTQAGGTIDLGVIGEGAFGGGSSRAFAVNDAGQVVGESTYGSSAAVHAFSWTQADRMVDLGTLGGASSRAVAVSGSGQVVGWSTSAGGFEHAFSWTSRGGMIDLGTLGGSSSRALAVDDSGEVVGEAQDLYRHEHAFSWTQAGGMVDLGTLGGPSSEAVAINDAGQIAGTSAVRKGATQIDHAVLWERGCVVPDVRHKTLARARPALARANCRVGKIRRIYSREPRRRVLAQSPKPWTRLAANAPVRLTVSKGLRKTDARARSR